MALGRIAVGIAPAAWEQVMDDESQSLFDQGFLQTDKKDKKHNRIREALLVVCAKQLCLAACLT